MVRWRRMDAPEIPHQHAAHTSHRWLDITLAIAAMFVSITSLVVAVEHGHTMQRLVEANSWPILQFETHNVAATGEGGEVRLTVVNAGVGHALIKSFEIWYKGQPMRGTGQLIGACCETTDEVRTELKTAHWSVGPVTSKVLRAGDHTDFLALPHVEEGALKNTELEETFDAARDKITVRICYCSVFDECWRSSGTAIEAERVENCPVPAVAYHVEDLKP